jgi:hypothetical protein
MARIPPSQTTTVGSAQHGGEFNGNTEDALLKKSGLADETGMHDLA